jgi:prevent-host-death family protein
MLKFLMEFNIHEAKTNLSQLIGRAEAGEEVIIARAGKPAVRLVPVEAAAPPVFHPGALKGRLIVSDNFLDPDPAMEELFTRDSVVLGEPDYPSDLAGAKGHRRIERF